MKDLDSLEVTKMSIKNTTYHKKLKKLCEEGKPPKCIRCGEEIDINDADKVECIKPKKAPEFYIHTDCI